jgi:alanine dehydrogenase
VSAVANLGWQQAISLDHAIAAGLTTHHGEITNLAVARAHGVDAVDPYSLVG